MSGFVELLLRLGCSLVGWMMVYTHVLWLATLRVIDCEQAATDEFWRLLLVFAPVAVGFSFLLGAMKKIPEIAGILRWFGLPMLLLVPLAAIPVITAFMGSTIGSQSLCGMEISSWHSWWAPLQLITLAVLTVNMLRVWWPTH